MRVVLGIDGIAEMRRKLKKMGDRTQRKFVRRALTAGTTPIVRDIRKNTPKETGNLKASIGRRMKSYPSGIIVAVLGARWPKGAHGHLLEFGTTQRPHPITGTSGIMPARPFMRPAVDRNRSKFARLFGGKLGAEIEREARRP